MVISVKKSVEKIITSCSVTIFRKVALLALLFLSAAVVKFDLLKGVDLT